MSGYILCQTKRAETPYFIENISTNIYSLEELCYYLYHNLYLIDETILNEGLCRWISQELALPELGEKLRSVMGKFASAEDILYPVFKEINYLTYEELRELNHRLVRFDKEPPLLRQKKKGDSMVENGMYGNAIRVYEDLLKQEGLEDVREGLTESIYHNLGCACSYLFQGEKALECFRAAYEGGRSRKALTVYLLAYRSLRTQEEYEALLEEMGVEEEVRQEAEDEWNRVSALPDPPMPSGSLEEILEGMTKEYHRSTGS